MRVLNRTVGSRRLVWRLLVPLVGIATAGQLALIGTASAARVSVTTARPSASSGVITAHWNRLNELDCNGWALKPKYNRVPLKQRKDWMYSDPAAPAMRSRCTDPAHYIMKKGMKISSRFTDNGWYIGHDEPSTKFISSRRGSGNNMVYGMQLSKDPATAPTPTGSVSDYGMLSVAPWFGLPICDPLSYPQNPCKPNSDSNKGGIANPKDAGSAFMELQFYPPGYTPFVDSTSCSKTQWCAALTIDSLECTFAFKTCNNNCIEPVNFAYLQTNGVPAGPPAPQDPSLSTYTGNSHTLKMNPGDVLKVSISSPKGGLLAKVRDLTTHKTGYIQASAKNGFADTSLSNCNGHKHTFRAEYNTAKKGNQVPWAALEGGVLMEQEIGHFEGCSSVTNNFPLSGKLSHGTSYSDPGVYQTCNGGSEGTTGNTPNVGEGPCNVTTSTCTGATTEGTTGPAACPSDSLTSGATCEFADGICVNSGNRTVDFNGKPTTQSWAVTGCTANLFQNGDLDYDGTTYQPDWPNGSPNHPTSIRYIGPFTHGHTYPKVQFETDAAGSEAMCDVQTGVGCTVPPGGAAFYPFWTMNKVQRLKGLSRVGSCVWNFGNVIAHVTKRNFGKDGEYGTPDIARYGGTVISKVLSNPTLARGCRRVILR
jgi:hypothetical protein